MPEERRSANPRHAGATAPRRLGSLRADPATTARHRADEPAQKEPENETTETASTETTARTSAETTADTVDLPAGDRTAGERTTEERTTGERTTEERTTEEQTTGEQTTEAPAATAEPEAKADAEPKDEAQTSERKPGPDRERHHGRERLRRALGRPGRGQVIAAMLLLLFGLAVVTQIRITTEDAAYANARREDLIQLLDGLTQENRRLEAELSDLERTRTNLQSGADAQQVAREEAESRIEVLSILAGTVPAEGQGIRMEIDDPQNRITAEILLDAVQEMRDAGAEVIEINDSIRLVAGSWFATGPQGLVVDGKPVTKPITIEVIGDPHSLSEGANFRGGIVSEITSSRVGGAVKITELQNVMIDSLHTPKPNQYAQPASAEPTR